MSRKFTYGETIVSGEVRLMFPHLDKPQTTGKYANNKYSLRVLVRKDDKPTLDGLKAALMDAAGGIKLSEMDKHPFMDDYGDMRDGDDEQFKDYEGYAGCLFWNMASLEPISCYSINEDGDVEELKTNDEIKREIYGGCHVQLQLTPAYWEEQTKKGVVKSTTFFCNGVLKVRDDKRLGGTRQDPRQAFLANLGKAPAGTSVKTVIDDDSSSEEPKRGRGRPKIAVEKANGRAIAVEEEEEQMAPPPPARKKTAMDNLLDD